MFLDERLRKATTFLVADVDRERKEIGTTFFVAKSLDTEDEASTSNVSTPASRTIYAVTARHTILDYKDEIIFIRVNTTDGCFEDLRTLASNWTPHPETDVAVYDMIRFKAEINIPGLGGQPDTKLADICTMNFTMLATSDYLNQTQVGEGHEVFILGLFTGHSGKKQALPIIRFGNIALMPREPVEVFFSQTDMRNNVKNYIAAHLVECRSMRGLSGSPVLFYEPPLGSNEVMGPTTLGAAMMTRFQLPVILGLVHGLYEEEESRLVKEINAGISIVIPSQKIRETIMQKKLAGERKQALEEKSPDSPHARKQP